MSANIKKRQMPSCPMSTNMSTSEGIRAKKETHRLMSNLSCLPLLQKIVIICCVIQSSKESMGGKEFSAKGKRTEENPRLTQLSSYTRVWDKHCSHRFKTPNGYFDHLIWPFTSEKLYSLPVSLSLITVYPVIQKNVQDVVLILLTWLGMLPSTSVMSRLCSWSGSKESKQWRTYYLLHL